MAGGEGGWGRVLDSIQDLVMARPRKPKNQAPANGRSRGGQRAVLYARVSTAEQEKEGFSIDAQVASIREYDERMGFVVAPQYVDVETAKKTGRTQFEAKIGRAHVCTPVTTPPLV